MNCDYLIVGAGFSGAVMAERIASQLNKKVILVEKRSHIGGNAYDEFDELGILVHKYGPHIFHTNSEEVFKYLSNFTDWRFYEHKVLADCNGEVFEIPINRNTINKFYKKNFTSEEEVQELYENIKEKRYPILNSEDVIVNQVGVELFEKFFKHYTKKQWQLEPAELSPQVCGRIPVRVNDDDRYFSDKYQYMPADGYTKMFEEMLEHENITVLLNTDYKTIVDSIEHKTLIYTGPIDSYFNYKFGKLPYRSIKFEYKHFEKEFYQSRAQINHVDPEIEYTRAIEHKYLSGQQSSTTTVSFEYPQFEGEPFYPIPTKQNREAYLKYEELARDLENVLFLGRLAEYQYYNMDQVIINTLNAFKKLLK